MQRCDLCGKHIIFCPCMRWKERKKKVQSHTYGEVVRKIAGVEDVTTEVLLRAVKFESMTLIKGQKIKKCRHNQNSRLFFILDPIYFESSCILSIIIIHELYF